MKKKFTTSSSSKSNEEFHEWFFLQRYNSRLGGMFIHFIVKYIDILRILSFRCCLSDPSNRIRPILFYLLRIVSIFECCFVCSCILFSNLLLRSKHIVHWDNEKKYITRQMSKNVADSFANSSVYLLRKLHILSVYYRRPKMIFNTKVVRVFLDMNPKSNHKIKIKTKYIFIIQ